MNNEAEEVLSEVMKSLPLVQAHALCLFEKEPDKIIQLISDELDQLVIWLSIERNFGAMGSVLFTEKTYYVLEIADSAAKKRNFVLSATILSSLTELCAQTALRSHKTDSDVENLFDSVLYSLKEWSTDIIPKDQIKDVSAILKKALKSPNIQDSGLHDQLEETIARFIQE